VARLKGSIWNEQLSTNMTVSRDVEVEKKSIISERHGKWEKQWDKHWLDLILLGGPKMPPTWHKILNGGEVY
jgi:hypothetical protein